MSQFAEDVRLLGELNGLIERAQRQAAPPALVWFWRLEEDRTEETRQTVKAAGVVNNLN